MVSRKEIRLARTHITLTDVIKQMYPKKKMPEATHLLAKDIFDGVDLRKKLKEQAKKNKNEFKF